MRRLFKHITSLTLPSFRQLHSNFRDFSNEVCHVMKSTMAEYCPGQSITCVDTSQREVSPETPGRHRDEGSLLSWRLGASCGECPQKPQSGKETAFACGYGELVHDVGSVPRNTSRAKRDPRPVPSADFVIYRRIKTRVVRCNKPVHCLCLVYLCAAGRKKTQLVDGGFDGSIKLIDLVTDFVFECPLVVAFYCNCPRFWLQVNGTSFGLPGSGAAPW